MFFKSISTIAAALCLSISTSAQAESPMLSSWYGGYFHGRTTANGETYNMYGHTAAHKTLPFGTKLRVCYDGCVNVRINDRGPFAKGRILDLSYKAARKLDFVNQGTTKVRIDVIRLGDNKYHK